MISGGAIVRRKTSSYEYLAIWLEDYGIRNLIGSSSEWIKREICGTISIDTSKRVCGETSYYQCLSIWLRNEGGQRNVISCSRINGGIQRAIGIQTDDTIPIGEIVHCKVTSYKYLSIRLEHEGCDNLIKRPWIKTCIQ